MSVVSKMSAAKPENASRYFDAKLSFETDCDDVASALRSDEMDFVLLHVIGSADDYAERHVPGALHFPHWTLDAQSVSQWPDDTLFVVYCAGPHCNGADKAAFALARLGRPVKVMIGGLTGWADEGLPFVKGPEPGNLKIS